MYECEKFHKNRRWAVHFSIFLVDLTWNDPKMFGDNSFYIYKIRIITEAERSQMYLRARLLNVLTTIPVYTYLGQIIDQCLAKLRVCCRINQVTVI